MGLVLQPSNSTERYHTRLLFLKKGKRAYEFHLFTRVDSEYHSVRVWEPLTRVHGVQNYSWPADTEGIGAENVLRRHFAGVVGYMNVFLAADPEWTAARGWTAKPLAKDSADPAKVKWVVMVPFALSDYDDRPRAARYVPTLGGASGRGGAAATQPWGYVFLAAESRLDVYPVRNMAEAKRGHEVLRRALMLGGTRGTTNGVQLKPGETLAQAVAVTKAQLVTRFKIATVTIHDGPPADTAPPGLRGGPVLAFGAIFGTGQRKIGLVTTEAGIYRVAMPYTYDPSRITAADLARDENLRVIERADRASGADLGFWPFARNAPPLFEQPSRRQVLERERDELMREWPYAKGTRFDQLSDRLTNINAALRRMGA